MAIGKMGEKECKMPKPMVEGPKGQHNNGSMVDTSAGPKGMRQTYKQTGKPGKGSK